MKKGKIVLMGIIVIVLVIALIFTIEWLKGEPTTEEAGAGLEPTQEENIKEDIDEDSEPALETEEDKPDENIIDEENTVNEEVGVGKVTSESQAIQIVKDAWGKDDTVYFRVDRIDSSGNYVICVREKTTTKAITWYTVTKDTGKILSD